MFNAMAFDKEIDDLLSNGQQKKAEEQMLKAYSELKTAQDQQELEYVAYRLAHFYSAPDTENLQEAEHYFGEREKLLPGSYTKCQTATFYFYVARDSQKTVRKVDEISPVEADRAGYYSALALKGQALIKLEMFNDAGKVIEQLLNLVNVNPSGLPYGDEINFLEAATQVPSLTAKCQGFLRLIIPKIHSQEYQKKAKAILEIT